MSNCLHNTTVVSLIFHDHLRNVFDYINQSTDWFENKTLFLRKKSKERNDSSSPKTTYVTKNGSLQLHSTSLQTKISIFLPILPKAESVPKSSEITPRTQKKQLHYCVCLSRIHQNNKLIPAGKNETKRKRAAPHCNQRLPPNSLNLNENHSPQRSIGQQWSNNVPNKTHTPRKSTTRLIIKAAARHRFYSFEKSVKKRPEAIRDMRKNREKMAPPSITYNAVYVQLHVNFSGKLIWRPVS